MKKFHINLTKRRDFYFLQVVSAWFWSLPGVSNRIIYMFCIEFIIVICGRVCIHYQKSDYIYITFKIWKSHIKKEKYKINYIVIQYDTQCL